MSDKLITGIVSVAIAIIGVASLAVLLSSQSQTSSIVSAGGNAFANALLCAEGPLTGGGQCGSSVSSVFNPS